MSDSQPPPNPQFSGDEPSLGSENAPQLTGREPRLGSVQKTLVGLPAVVRVRMAETLARTGNPAAMQFLREALLEGDAQVIQAAARTLGQLKDPQALDALAEVIGNTNLEALARIEAMKAVGQIGERRGLSILLDAENDPDPTVREARVRALGNLGARLEDENPQLRAHVLDALQAAFDDDDPTVREVSVIMVSWVGGSSVRRILFHALTSPHVEVVRAATRLLPLENISQGRHNYSYLQNLRRYRSAFRQALQLAAWLVRGTHRPGWVDLLIFAIVVGVIATNIPWTGIFTDIYDDMVLDGQGALTVILIAAAFQLMLAGAMMSITHPHRFNEQFAALRVTHLDKGILLLSYIFVGIYRTWVWFAVNIVLLPRAWPAIATVFLKMNPPGWLQTGLVIVLWLLVSVFTIAASVVFTLTLRQEYTFRRAFIDIVKQFAIFTLVTPIILTLVYFGILALTSLVASSWFGSLVLIVVSILAAFFVGKLLLNRFKNLA